MFWFWLHCTLASVAATHAIARQKPRAWVWAIWLLPYLGSMSYALRQFKRGSAELGPQQALAPHPQRQVDPDAERRHVEALMALQEGPSNSGAKARSAAQKKDFASAAALFREALAASTSQDPTLLLELARTEFAAQNYSATQQVLQALRAAGTPSLEAQLLEARTLEASGQITPAITAYQALVRLPFPGEEARARLAQLLAHNGQAPAAEALLSDMQRHLSSAPKHYQISEAAWLRWAKKAVSP